jgi:hypothetical protein
MRLLRSFLRLPALARQPAGRIPDAASMFGLDALLSNANAYCGHLDNIVSAGTDVPLTTSHIRRAVLRITAGASGGFTITLPSTKTLIANLGPTIITDGTYGQRFSILNDGVGQTGTLTAGDASTTITGTATVLTNTRRDFFLMVTSPTTVTYYNLGSAAI